MKKTTLFLSLAILFGSAACDKQQTPSNSSNTTTISTPQTDTRQPENAVAIMKNYHFVYSFQDGLAKVQKNEQYGLIDKNGKEVVAVQYDELYPFHEGLAFVKKGEKVGFIDKTGNEVVPIQYDDDEDYYMELSHPPFFANKIVSLNKNGKAVLVDNTGKELNLKQYETPYSPYYYWFSEGLAAVQQNGKWGFIDTTGKEVIAPQYDSADSFNNGLAQVEQNGQSVFIDKTGKAVFSVPQHYDYIYPFSDGLAKVEKNGKLGFMDKTGKEVIPVQYYSAYEFSEGLAFVKKEENGKWGVIDKTGQEVVPYQYDIYFMESENPTFKNGFARVMKNDKHGLIDKTGREVVPLQYDTILWKFNDGLARVEKDGKYGFVDTTGREVVLTQYQFAHDFSEGLAAVEKENKYGFIDTTGKEVIPCEYNETHDFSEGLAAVKTDDGWQFIDKTGKVVISAEPNKFYQAEPAIKNAPPLPQRFSIDNKQYSVPLYTGEIASKLALAPDFDDWKLEENLQEALQEAQTNRQNINFAGQYMLVQSGCGTGCLVVAVLDIKTGKITDSLYVSGYPVDKDGKDASDEFLFWVGNEISHQKDSRLLFVEGDLGEDENGFGGTGSFAFELKDGKLQFLQHSPMVQMSEL